MLPVAFPSSIILLFIYFSANNAIIIDNGINIGIFIIDFNGVYPNRTIIGEDNIKLFNHINIDLIRALINFIFFFLLALPK